MPAGLIMLNQLAFVFISTIKIRKAKTRILMPVQMPTHAGVACIFEIPAMGLVINPNASIATAMANISGKKFFFPSLTILLYNTEIIIPAMISDISEPLPKNHQYFSMEDTVSNISV